MQVGLRQPGCVCPTLQTLSLDCRSELRTKSQSYSQLLQVSRYTSGLWDDPTLIVIQGAEGNIPIW